MTQVDSSSQGTHAGPEGLPRRAVNTVKTVLSPRFIKSHKLFIILLFLLCLYPIGPQLAGMDYLIHIAVIANLFAIIAIAWDINGGYTGQGNLAPGLFAGIAGYTSAILTTQAGWPILPSAILGVFFSFLIALGIGFPSLRVRGPYLVIVTFSVAEVARKLTIYYSAVTKGEEGIGGIPRIVDGAFANFYWTLFMLMVVFIVSKIIIESKWGLAFKAIAADETRARTLGIDVTWYKLLSFSICGVVAGIGGVLYAHYQAHIDPSFFAILMAILIISMAVTGGEKTLLGPIVGAYILQFSSEGLRFASAGAPWVRLIMYGLLLSVVMLFLPGGILSLFRNDGSSGKVSASNRVMASLRKIFLVQDVKKEVVQEEAEAPT